MAEPHISVAYTFLLVAQRAANRESICHNERS